ncbi:hypothetical protein Pint_23745 [Pistacia integerrima]|uniref:Uncharacterized protein n=1 Tax=Pistacia integerrima TaxID=434235 RepID=A0ACC0YM61_9ROSI|nr:hypothetical protein Pint_23745 [Pistacia integerrima]
MQTEKRSCSVAGYDINVLFQEAQTRWLKPAEVLYILQNHEKYELNQEPPQKPTGGSVFLFNKRVLRFFRKDGHNWRKKKDGRAVGEAHERLKVGNLEALNCYYAHGEQNPNFQRRSYWMLDPYVYLQYLWSVYLFMPLKFTGMAYEHIVLVHYREITEGKPSPGSVAVSPGASSSFLLSPTSYTSQNPGSTSTVKGKLPNCAGGEVNRALRKLEQQLSLNDDIIEEIDSLSSQDLEYKNEMSKQDQFGALLQSSEYALQGQYNGGHAGFLDDSNNLVLSQNAGRALLTCATPSITIVVSNHFVLTMVREVNLKVAADGFTFVADDGEHLYGHGYMVESKETSPWKDMLDSCENSSGVELQGKLQTSSRTAPAEEQEHTHWLNSNIVENSTMMLPQEAEDFKIPAYSSLIGTHEIDSEYYTMFSHQEHIGASPEPDLILTVAEKLKFKIREISPEWGYATEPTKQCPWVVLFSMIHKSSFPCIFVTHLSSLLDLFCVIHQNLHGHACLVTLKFLLRSFKKASCVVKLLLAFPERFTLCITSSNRQACSEIKEFDYRVKASSSAHDNLTQTQATKSRDELLLLVRFVQMLLSDSSLQKGDSMESGCHLLGRMKADDDLWDQVLEALLVSSGTSSSSGTIDWLLQELLKDKLQQWLSSKSTGDCEQSGCSLSKKEQGIIHMVAGLGFEWALNPILSHGVSINFRDITGWTALHWAARFGREKMVAALLASGASAGAVTDPSAQDPTGKTPAFIAASSGHKGLAGYLSEVALTSHLSSLTLEESELSKGSAEVEAEITVNSVSKGSLSATEDQLSMKDTLAAVRNATQAAARIQSAFRAHSFRRRQDRDEYGISGLSALSKLAFRNARDYNSAALSIQKKFRGWKGRKDYLALRQKVVKIQAHVRGYQVRKKYKVICWAVGVLDKVILRWRRKGVGLRGFRSESERNDESEDEDILKVFRRQKVDAAIDEAVSRVLSMVDSPDARHQYRRMLERFRQAKAERGETSEEASSISVDDIAYTENDDWYCDGRPKMIGFLAAAIGLDATCSSAIVKDDKVELIGLAIEKLIEEKKKKKDGSSHDDQLLLSNLLSQLESLRGDEALKQSGGVTEPEAVTSPAAVGESHSKGVDGSQLDNGGAENDLDEIANELRKLKRQNLITHCLLSVMIVLTVVWQLSEVKLIWHLKEGLSHPFRSAGSMLMGLLRRSRNNGQYRERISLIESHLKMPELPHMDLSEFRLNGEKALNHHRSAWHDAKNSLIEFKALPSLKLPQIPHKDLLEFVVNGEEA